MRFSEIYDRVIRLWPEEIPISDGEPMGDGFLFPKLSLAWDAVEDVVGGDDPWAQLMAWTMFKVFHRESERLHGDGLRWIRPREVDSHLVEEQYFVGLSGEGWERELAAYQRS